MIGAVNAGPRLRAQLSERGDLVYLRLDGVVDESNKLDTVLSATAQKVVVLDTPLLTQINSFGVRDFRNWVTSLEERKNPLVHVRLSPALTTQAGMVAGLLGKKPSIHSVMAPYYCESCSADRTAIVTADKFSVEGAKAPPATCPKCKGTMEFDDFTSSVSKIFELSAPLPMADKVLPVVQRVETSALVPLPA